ncbi:triacylglycerol lipase [Acinetobacter variabilis]|uniref:Triacylglycerol lipase n=1 Tax=Acinetobacter variabilis TaxID=70346 RepID=A0A427LRG6_9GAMM|nr:MULTISPECIES: triacylglycerol lipase [Acinetobacter]MCU4629141.1 triacylglycerol lipase [Acinetobacter variabilis]QQN89586.1 triacylglycerol lipase [Acinetobacter variabilis]QXR20762.1 triacylglycerol lipase [Acinetobacter variabilis]WKT74717.1 triacylglycerol lipase [Acinetobacter variabilis]WPC36285.1 triacylglycerol lipase [Acinetobacter sp. YWS30-1]
MKYGVLTTGLLMAAACFTAHASTQASQVTAKASSQYAKTKYPIVFSHGMAGFIRVGTDQFGLDYWYQILPDLARNGANVWATRVSPFNSSEIRGEQLLEQVKEIAAITGADKVNLIGHSHGGPTIRYVAGSEPKLVASLTTVGAPHKGSPVADLILKAEGTAIEAPLVGTINLVSKAITWAQGLDPNSYPHDSLAGGSSLTALGSANFNQRYPIGMPTTTCGEGAYQQKGIYNYSFTGVGQVTNPLDPDSALKVTALLIDGGKENDGLVSRCSAKFGKTIRDNYNWNHLDEVNQLLGLKNVFAPDPVDVYRQHANRLKLQGL